MTDHIMDPHNPEHPSYQLGLEASQWLVCLTDTQPQPDDPYFDAEKRSAAFLEWITRSPQHVSMFLDTYETYQRLGNIDPNARIEIDELLAARQADVIQLFGPAQTPVQLAVEPAAQAPVQPSRRSRVAIRFAAAAAMLVIASLISFWMFGASEYVTSVGEQRTCKLEDGSFIYLNTNSRVRVQFTRRQRHIDLIRGEALFAVEHDMDRPFVVTASGTNIRAVGTQFNVRRRAASTDVTVVEGVVQVTTEAVPESSGTANGPQPTLPPSPGNGAEVEGAGTSVDSGKTGKVAGIAPASAEPLPLKLAAGEKVSVAEGHFNKQTHPNVVEALSWRERRLMFRDTPFADVAAEFNRYNLRQIRIEGPIDMELTGTFDADRPTALILYAMRQPSLDVIQVGDNWIIRSK